MAPPASNKKPLFPEVLTASPRYDTVRPPDEVLKDLGIPLEPELKARPCYLKVGAISSVKGSAYMEYGGTKVLVAVEPPKEITNKSNQNGALGVIECCLSYAPQSTYDTSSIVWKESFLSVALKKALDPVVCRHEFPNFRFEIKVTVLEDDGCVLSTAINCCGVALVECGVATFSLISASTACFYKGRTIVNPCAEVEQMISNMDRSTDDVEYGIVVITNMAEFNQVSECYVKGYLQEETFKKLTGCLFEVNEDMLKIIQLVLTEKVRRYFKEANKTKRVLK